MDILKNIIADLDWRSGELAILKTLPHRYNILDNHQILLKTYLVPAIYALWEGYVCNSFQSYIRFINSLNLCANELHINILTFALMYDIRLNLGNPRLHLEKQKKIVEIYNNTISKTININPSIPTRSNVNYDVINEILQLFNLSSIDITYKSPLNKLLKFRNSIAHGERAIPVKDENIMEFTNLLINLMSEIYLKIENGIKSKSYLSDSDSDVPLSMSTSSL